MNVKYSFFLLLLLSWGLLHAQRKPKIKGNRDVIEVSKTLPEFHAIRLLDDLKISLEFASEQGYTVTADDNLIDILKFDVDADTLFISSYYTVTAKKQLDITIRYNDLQAISLDDGQLEVSNPIDSEILNVRAGALSQLQLQANTHFLRLHMEAQSKGDFNVESDSLEMVLNGRADARIYQVSSAMSLSMGDHSDATLEGTTTTLELQMNAGSELGAERLQAEVIKANLDGTARARMRPTRLLELSSRGSANTYLYGDAQISILEFGDTSELYKRSD